MKNYEEKDLEALQNLPLSADPWIKDLIPKTNATSQGMMHDDFLDMITKATGIELPKVGDLVELYEKNGIVRVQKDENENFIHEKYVPLAGSLDANGRTKRYIFVGRSDGDSNKRIATKAKFIFKRVWPKTNSSCDEIQTVDYLSLIAQNIVFKPAKNGDGFYDWEIDKEKYLK